MPTHLRTELVLEALEMAHPLAALIGVMDDAVPRAISGIGPAVGSGGPPV